MKIKYLLALLMLISAYVCSYAYDSYEGLSQKLVEAVREGKSTKSVREELRAINPEALKKALATDREKKAFWINIYNGMVQVLLQKNPALFNDRDKFFKEERVEVAGKKMSLDQIEHGIIRGTKLKLGLGMIGDPFADDFVKEMQVEKADGRIHFALNCGAKSCPPVAVYRSDRLDEQLDESTRQYLKRTTEYNNDVAKVTPLFSWFRGDFGGTDGIVSFLKKYDAIPQGADPKLEYKDYDWTLSTGNFQKL